MGIVLKDFRCKVTKRLYRAGETYGGERLEELQALGFVEKFKSKKTASPSK